MQVIVNCHYNEREGIIMGLNNRERIIMGLNNREIPWSSKITLGIKYRYRS